MTHLDTSARRFPPSSDGFTCRGCPQGSRRASCDACPARHVSAVTPSHDAALGTLRPGHAHTAHARRGTCRTGPLAPGGARCSAPWLLRAPGPSGRFKGRASLRVTPSLLAPGRPSAGPASCSESALGLPAPRAPPRRALPRHGCGLCRALRAPGGGGGLWVVAFRVRCAPFVKRKLFMTMHSIRHFCAFLCVLLKKSLCWNHKDKSSSYKSFAIAPFTFNPYVCHLRVWAPSCLLPSGLYTQRKFN